MLDVLKVIQHRGREHTQRSHSHHGADHDSGEKPGNELEHDNRGDQRERNNDHGSLEFRTVPEL